MPLAREHDAILRHEQGAGFIAQGWARATGEAAVCVASSGPGATNLVTAIAVCVGAGFLSERLSVVQLVGVLIIAHGPFADALISSATHVMGKRPLNVTGIAVSTQDKPDAVLDQARRAKLAALAGGVTTPAN